MYLFNHLSDEENNAELGVELEAAVEAGWREFSSRVGLIHGVPQLIMRRWYQAAFLAGMNYQSRLSFQIMMTPDLPC